MPLRHGELCEGCHRHIHPQTEPSKSHPPPGCDSCLPPGFTLLACGGCKFTRYCGKACQKGHRAVHKEECKSINGIKECTKMYGPEMEAKQASFSRWCENNCQAFGEAAFKALEILSPLHQQRAYEYILFVVVRTEVVTVDDGKPNFDHSIITASKESRQSIHDMHDKQKDIFHKDIGGPAAVEKFLLASSSSMMRVVLHNINLLPPVNQYTLTFNIDGKNLRYCHDLYDPDWFNHLKNKVK